MTKASGSRETRGSRRRQGDRVVSSDAAVAFHAYVDPANGNSIVIDMGSGSTALFSHGRNAMSVFDPKDGRIIEVNDAWVQLYGWSRAEARAMRVMDVSAEPDTTRKAVMRAKDSGGEVIDLRWHRKRDGTVFPVELTSGTLRDGDNVVMYAVMHDITERHRAEEALQRSEARFRALIEHMPDGVVVHSFGKIAYMNPALRALLGFATIEEVVGREAISIVHPDDRDQVIRRVSELLINGLAAPLMEERLQRSDGSAVPAEVSAIPIEFDAAPAVLAMVRDVRARKQMEAQLLLADRLASLGRLAASVGHEINNPLAYMLGTVQVLQREISQCAEFTPAVRTRVLERLGVLGQGAERVRDIVKDLKALSVSEGRVVGPIDLHRVLDLCANMAEHEIQHRARLVRQYGPPVQLEANEARLGQVFLNLLVNAAQSIDAGNGDDNEVRIVTACRDDETVVVDIVDTGHGIDPALRDRIFEPFFTTKEPMVGTGLGLSISHAIVTAHGGTIEALVNEPRGTRFRVTLPLRGPANG